MKRYARVIVSAVLIFTLTGTASVTGAPLGKSVTGSAGQALLEVTTLAGTGEYDSANGKANAASFRTPSNLLVLPGGTVLISDAEKQLIRQYKGNEVTTYAGIILDRDEQGLPAGALVDGEKAEAVFNRPSGLAKDAAGNVYVADAENHAIRKIGKDGAVTTVAGNGVLGLADGKGAEARFYHPMGIAAAADGTLYVADTLNHVIRKIGKDGMVTTLTAVSDRVVEVFPGEAAPAGDFRDGKLAEAKFNEPTSLEMDASGNLYVSDTGNQRIRYIDLQAGTVTTVAGSAQADGASGTYEEQALYANEGYADGKAAEAQFNFPRGLQLTEEGGLLIADTLNHAIRYLHEGVVTTVVGVAEAHGMTEGIEGAAQLHKPTDVALWGDGSLLIADAYNNKIRRVAAYALPGTVVKDKLNHVVYGDAEIGFEAQARPEVRNGRLLVPIAPVGKALGFKAEYDKASNAARFTKGDLVVEFAVGKAEMKKRAGDAAEEVIAIDAAAVLKNGRIYAPIRYLAEEANVDVQWNSEFRTVILRDLP